MSRPTSRCGRVPSHRSGWKMLAGTVIVHSCRSSLVKKVGVVGRGVLLTPSVMDQTGQTKMASVGDGGAVAVL